MIVLDAGRTPVKTVQCWFPGDSASAAALLATAPLVDVMQCSAQVAGELAGMAWRVRDFTTLLIDASADEDALWHRLEKRTCRYQLRRAERLAPELVHVAAGARDPLAEQQARGLITAFIQRKRFRPAVTDAEWARLRRDLDLFVARSHGRAIAAHLVLVAAGERAAAIMSATADRKDQETRTHASALNRWLHWQEIRWCRSRGIRWYDFGGLFDDPRHPDASIDHFKLGFGGEVVVERIVRLCRSPVLRSALRWATRLRRRSSPGVTEPSSRRGRQSHPAGVEALVPET